MRERVLTVKVFCLLYYPCCYLTTEGKGSRKWERGSEMVVDARASNNNTKERGFARRFAVNAKKALVLRGTFFKCAPSSSSVTFVAPTIYWRKKRKKKKSVLEIPSRRKRRRVLHTKCERFKSACTLLNLWWTKITAFKLTLQWKDCELNFFKCDVLLDISVYHFLNQIDFLVAVHNNNKQKRILICQLQNSF